MHSFYLSLVIYATFAALSMGAPYANPGGIVSSVARSPQILGDGLAGDSFSVADSIASVGRSLKRRFASVDASDGASSSGGVLNNVANDELDIPIDAGNLVNVE